MKATTHAGTGNQTATTDPRVATLVPGILPL